MMSSVRLSLTPREINTLYCLVDAALYSEKATPDTERVSRLVKIQEKLNRHCSDASREQ